MANETLPQPVLDAVEEVVKASQHYAEAAARNVGRDSDQAFLFAVLQEKRRALVTAINQHASAMYEAGIEMGRAEASGSK